VVGTASAATSAASPAAADTRTKEKAAAKKSLFAWR